MVAVLENPEQTEELLQKMDAALAALPLDFEAYGQTISRKQNFFQNFTGMQKEPIRYFRHRKQNHPLQNRQGTR